MSDLTIIERFREGHHAVARMLAAGMTPSMVRQRTGYSTRRLTLLMGDSAFNDLIAHYAKRFHAQWDIEDDIYATMMSANRIRAEFTVTEHMDRAEDVGELIPLAMADKISQSRADRQGYGKHSTVTHNHDFAAALDRAIERSGMKTIDAKVSPALVAPDASSEPAQAPTGTEECVLPPPPSPPNLAEAVTNQPTPPRTTTGLSCSLWSQETAAVGEKDAASSGSARPARDFAVVLKRRRLA